MRHFQLQVVMVLGAALSAVFASGSPVSAEVTYDTRVLTGDAAPGTDEGAVFSRLGLPVINRAGQIAFSGTLTGKGVQYSNDAGIWSGGACSLRLVARKGAAAPGTGEGPVYRELLSPVLNDAGQTAFGGYLIGKGVHATNRVGIWSEGSGSLRLVARSGDAAPGTESVFRFVHRPVLSGAGQTAFRGKLGRGGAGIWLEVSGSLKLVAREGDAAPGTAEGVIFSDFNDLVLNGAGQTAFSANIAVMGVGRKGKPKRISSGFGIWSGGAGSLRLVARDGDAAPGTDAVFSRFGYPVLNGAGQLAFSGGLTGKGVKGSNNTAIWREGSGSLRLVAREGDVAPGTAEGVIFSDFSDPVLNGAGQTAFRGGLSSRRTSIWLEGSGSLKLIVRSRDAAPGTAQGVRFSNNFGYLVLNGAGQIAFRGEITGTPAGVGSRNNAGIWATDPSGVLTLIARTGELFDVNDDPRIDKFRTIRQVLLLAGSRGDDGRATSFNDAGQLAFYLTFTDDSEGIFVATISNSATAVMPPIQTKPSLNTDDAESNRTQDDAPIARPQPSQQHTESNQDTPADKEEQEDPDE